MKFITFAAAFLITFAGAHIGVTLARVVAGRMQGGRRIFAHLLFGFSTLGMGVVNGLRGAGEAHLPWGFFFFSIMMLVAALMLGAEKQKQL